MRKLYLLLLAVIMMCSAHIGWGQEINENFNEASDWVAQEGVGITSYGNHSINGFQLNSGLRESAANSRGGVGHSVRLRNAASPIPRLEYTGEGTGKSGGVGVISFWYRHWNGTGAAIDFEVEISTNGIDFILIESVTGFQNANYTEFSSEVNNTAENIWIRVSTNGAERLIIDDFSITDYDPTALNITLDTDGFDGDFGNVEAGNTSAISTFSFTAENIEVDDEVSVTAPAGFELNDEGTAEDWVTVLNFPETDGEANGTIQVRFAPTVADGATYNDNITLTSTDATMRTIAVSGQEACVFPASQVSGLAAANETTNSADINWTDPAESAQVLIIMREGSAVNYTPDRGTTYTANADFSAGDDLGDGNKVVFTGNTTDETASISGLSPFTTYHVQAFVYDESNECYNTTTAPTVEFTTEADSDDDSSIAAPTEQIEATNLVSNTVVGEFAGVFNFDITDAGSGDTEPTIVNQVVIEAGPDNQADFSSRIADAQLVNLAGDVVITATVGITADKITFTIADGNLNVADGTTVNLQLQIELDETLTDGEQIQFQIPDEHEFVASVDGSVFEISIDPIIGNIHTIDVVATTFDITAPATVNAGFDFTIELTAVDDFDNTDTAARTVTLSVAGGTGTLSGDITDLALTDGQLTTTALSYDVAEQITVNITDGIITEGVIIEVEEFAGGGLEDFTNSNATSAYADGSFVGNDGIVWQYLHSRDEDNYPIDGAGIMLRRASDSRLISENISGGVGNFSFEFRKAFTGGAERQLEVIFNEGEPNEQIFTTIAFGTIAGTDETDVYIFDEDVNIGGNFSVTIKLTGSATTNRQTVIDNISWTPFTPCEAPTTQASAAETADINNETATINWTAGNGSNSLVVVRASGAVDFTPNSGTDYSADANADFLAATDLGDGNKVVYAGDLETIAISGLTQGTGYHLAVFTFDDSEYCYNTVDPARTDFATSSDNDTNSTVLAPAAQIAAATIPSTVNDQVDAIEVFSFVIEDAGGDGEPTLVNQVVIEKAANNTVADWSATLAGATLVGADDAQISINADDITITFSEGDELEIAEGDELALTLAIWLNTNAVNDGDLLAFEIPETHGFIALGTGSAFEANLTAGAITSNDFTLELVFDDIADVRAAESGQFIVKGIVLLNDFGTASNNQFFVQDATAGINIFKNGKEADVVAGTEVIVRGTRGVNSGQVQISATSIQIISIDNPLPVPVVQTVNQLDIDAALQGSRVRIENVTFDDLSAWPTEPNTGAGINFIITSAEESVVARVPRNNPFINGEEAPPYGRIDLEGVQARNNTTLQVIFSNLSDIQDNYEPLFVSGTPTVNTATTEGFTISAQIDEPGEVFYVVVTNGASAPSAAQIKAGQDQSGAAALASGSFSFNAEELGEAKSAVINGLQDGTAYDIYFIAEDLNNNISGTPILREITTVDGSLDTDAIVEASATPIAAVNLNSNTASTEAVAVFNFDLTDGGGSDGAATILETILIGAGAANEANFNERIADAKIYDGGTEVPASLSKTANSLSFELTNPVEVTDGESKTFQLRIQLAENLTDGEALQFSIPATSSGWVVSTSGTQLSADFGAAVTSATHIIDVVATAFAIQVPGTIIVNSNFNVGVRATDSYGNTDTAIRSISITASGEGNLSGNTADQEMAGGEFTFTGLAYDAEEAITFTVTDGTLSNESVSVQVESFQLTSVETFDNATISSSYSDGSFVGNNGVEWFYEHSRNEGDFPIDGKGLMLRRASDSRFYASAIDGGLSELSFQYRKAFTGTAERQLEVIINEGQANEVIFTTDAFGTTSGEVDSVFTFTQDNINIEGVFSLKIKLTGESSDNRQTIIDNITWSYFTTDPILFTNLSAFNSGFGEVQTGSSSGGSSFAIIGENLIENVIVTPPVNFEVSLSNDFENVFDNENPLEINVEVGATFISTVYARFSPKSPGTFVDEILISAEGATSRAVQVSGVGIREGLELIFFEDFENCDELNAFISFSVVGDEAWECTTLGYEGSAVRMSGFNDGAFENEDWLITPRLAVQSYEHLELDFYSRYEFPDNTDPLSVLISTNYSGEGNPNAEGVIWEELDVTLASNSTWTYSGINDISEYADESVYIAFKYISETNAARWTIDNVRLRGVLKVDAPNIIVSSAFEGDFGFVALGETSDASSYSVSAVNLEESLTITPPPAFELSLDSDFTNIADTENPLVIEPNEGTIEATTIYVRFVPVAELTVYSGNIVHSSDPATVRNLAVSGREGIEGAAISIAAARNLPNGTEVRIGGVVIGGPNNEADNRIIYDGTAGIVIRQASGDELLRTNQLVIGDRVEVVGITGAVGLLKQVSTITELSIVEQGQELPQFTEVTVAALKADFASYESQLVRIVDVNITDDRTQFVGGGSAGNFSISQESEQMIFRIGSAAHPLVGTDIPQGEVTFEGYLGAFNQDIQVFVNDENGLIIPPANLSVDAPSGGINLGTVNRGETSAVQSYKVSGANLPATVLLEVGGQFRISTSEGSGYASSLTLNTDGGELDATVFVRIQVAESLPLGTLSNTITHTAGDITETVAVSVTIAEVASADKAFDHYFRLYPNPTANHFVIEENQLMETEVVKAYLFDLRGAKVQDVHMQAGGRTQIDISHLSNGVYNLIIQTEANTFRTKVMVVR